MNAICSQSKFWDSKETWYTNNPDFTVCFHKTALSWTPAIFMLIVLVVRAADCCNRDTGRKTWTMISVLRVIIPLLMIKFRVSETVLYYHQGRYVELWSSLTVLLGLVCAIKRMNDLGKYVHTSVALFAFWSFMALGSLVTATSVGYSLYEEKSLKWILEKETFQRIITDFPFSLAMFFLVQIQDLPNELYDGQIVSFYDRASVVSKFTFYWMVPVIATMKQKVPITSTHYLIDVLDIDKCEELHERLGEHWETRKPGAILWPLFKTFRSSIIKIFVCKLVQVVATLSLPVFGDLLLTWLSDPDRYVWHAYFYVMMIFVGRIVLVLNIFRASNITQRFSLEMRTLLTSMIHRKILKMSPLVKAKYTSGQLSNLAFTDPQRIVNVFQYLPELFNIPLTIGFCLYLLWAQLGSATITALISLLSLIPITFYAKKKFQALQKILMKAKDGRAKLISEILNSIKAIKLYAWEKPLTENVEKKRNEEMATIRKQIYYLCITDLVTNCAGVIVSNLTFITFCLVNDGIVTASRAFVSLNLFTTIRQRLRSINTIMVALAESSVARNRLVSFFNGEDDEHAPIRFKEKVEFAISVQNGSYSWSKDGDLKLENVNANFRTGSLTAVIGPVGSGKSSLISAILGDMCRARGIVKINGSIAHIPQTSWIQNATIKKNIMFTSEIEARKYRGIIDACALEDDLKILPAGDETEIGEKGINLSGGQKQRVSLARAVYSDKDIYLLDDTLSAVDANVGNHLFEQVIGPNGLLKNKTRVLVTHKLSVLPFVDNVIIMKDGQVDYQGSYGRLMKERPNYMEFVHKREVAEVEKNDEKTSKQSKEDGQVSRKGRLIKREQLNSNSVMMKVFFQYVKTVNWKRLAYFLFSFAARVGSAVLATLWLAEWAADSENTMRRMDIVLRNIRLTVYSLFGVAQAATSIMLTYGLYTIAADSSKVLHSQMLIRILKAPMSYFDTTPTGRILNRFTSDVYSNDTSLRDSSRTLSLILVAGFNSGILIVLKTPLSLIAIVSVFVLNAWSQNRYLKTSRQLQRIESASRSVVYSQLSETISGSTLIRAYEAVAVFNGNCDTKLNSYNVAAYCRAITRNWMKAVAGSLGALFILSSLGLVLIADLSASTAGIIFGASSAITSAIVQGYEQYATLESCLVAVERCQEFKVTPVEEEDVSCVEPTLGWPQDGSIVFANYSAKYRQELGNVLNNMNLEIAGGEKVGIVGRTGAGKSSILLALFRIIEAAEGNILIDNHDCSKLRLADLRSRMCIIPQDPVLFIGTLRYNLDPFLYHTDDELWTALEIVQLKNFASSLDGGLDHEISEGGENLSVGQRQLVCMARALLRKSKILVLDEATAAIDNDTDDLIQKTIRTEFADCTILTIAHRLNTILDYDKILVMDQGNVAEYDQPNILLKRTDSLFYKLAKDARLI